MILADKVRELFINRFHSSPAMLVRSPGRINIIGEHTDYNGGLVMPCAIDRQIVMAFSLNGTKLARIYASDLDSYVEINIDDLKPKKLGSFENFLLGVYFEINKLQANIGGFDLVVAGDIPLGAGLSSSAALTCCMAYALDQSLNLQLDRISLARIVQDAHHSFVGVKCGMLDQMASLLGKENRAISIDCKTLDYHYLSIPSHNLDWFLINSNVEHSHAENAYNDRVESCNFVLEMARKLKQEAEVLSDLTLHDLEKIKSKLKESEFKMARYVLEENQRVIQMELAMELSDEKRIGQLLYEGHQGLSEEYMVSCPEVDFIVKKSKKESDIFGARMVGGGFGGCIIFASKKGNSGKEFFERLDVVYESKFEKKASFMEFKIEDGTSVVV